MLATTAINNSIQIYCCWIDQLSLSKCMSAPLTWLLHRIVDWHSFDKITEKIKVWFITTTSSPWTLGLLQKLSNDFCRQIFCHVSLFIRPAFICFELLSPNPVVYRSERSQTNAPLPRYLFIELTIDHLKSRDLPRQPKLPDIEKARK